MPELDAITGQMKRALQVAAEAPLVFRLTYREHGRTIRASVVPDGDQFDLDAGELPFFAVEDGRRLIVSRDQVEEIGFESLVYEMAELIIQTAGEVARDFNRLLKRKLAGRLNREEKQDIAMKVAMLYLCMLQFRQSFDLPPEVRDASIGHHEFAIPETLIRYKSEQEEIGREEQEEFCFEFFAAKSRLVDAIEQFLRKVPDEGEMPDSFWFFAKSYLVNRKLKRVPAGELVKRLNAGLGTLDLNGYMKELTTPAELTDDNDETAE
ncbi:MAG: hypothetical protein MAG453_02152 [Calditrichaeota bacterium]|nr:hypothetical protein [Calditrichota bacterium]